MLALYISLLDTEEQISKFEHIYTKYRGLMFYTAKGVLQDSYLAEDAVHETFLDIIRIIDIWMTNPIPCSGKAEHYLFKFAEISI